MASAFPTSSLPRRRSLAISSNGATSAVRGASIGSPDHPEAGYEQRAHDAPRQGESPTMPRLLETTRAARREQILLAAQACFARRGYHVTTMEEIAAEAGSAKGAAYSYFDGKEAIFLALYDD